MIDEPEDEQVACITELVKASDFHHATAYDIKGPKLCLYRTCLKSVTGVKVVTIVKDTPRIRATANIIHLPGKFKSL